MTNRQQERRALSAWGRYRTGSGTPYEVLLNDISEQGCQFADKLGRLEPGRKLTIRIGTIGPIDAVVMWTRDRKVGVRFVNPLYPSVMEHIIAQQSQQGG
jgi:hypothetical protein